MLTTLNTPEELSAHLDKAGTKGPTLHPHKDSPSRYGPESRWNGWNLSVCVGQENDGLPIVAEKWHFADGHTSESGGPAHATPTMAKNFPYLKFPVYMLDAVSVVRYPEHTP